ncbi:putative urease accessory protein [Rosellinia necatrix]|uniref:Putative urease accessory protein n=1 Tax=Rosellinia necatrix TaxID=77044 RepID=A0A1W2TWT4_ROSNE|nr:putative urease accessory protein [Rosellinia necatrix]
MPHKHTRKLQDESTFDLPPTQVAKPLPVKQSDAKENGRRGAKAKDAPVKPTNNQKRKRVTAPKDDAPRAFKRLMAFANGKKPRSGLDNGDKPRGAKAKKRNAAQEASVTDEAEVQAKPATTAIPTIRPGERMSEFSARVDAALPLAGLVNNSAKGNKDPLGLKVWRTHKEKKMHKMYDEWREQDRKIKEQREEELELEAEKELEDEESGVSWKLNMAGQTGGKRKKRAKDDEDPWEILRKQRGEARPGLRDVAMAPPELTAKPTKQLLVRGATVQVHNVPKAAGSLKRREELQEVRNDIIAAYRKKMGEKRPSLYT